jgi:hypothetical protein
MKKIFFISGIFFSLLETRVSSTTQNKLTQIENYMDKTCDQDRDMFTQGQKTRIDHFINNDGVLSTVINSNGFENASKDFIVFDDHDNSFRDDRTGISSMREYNYNSTTPIVTLSTSPYSSMIIRGLSSFLFPETAEGVSVTRRSRKEVHINPGFFAESNCEFQAWVDPALPDPPAKRGTEKQPIVQNTALISIKSIYPNPTSGNINIKFDLGRDALVTLAVFDVLGNQVAFLMNAYDCNAGENNYSFNLSNLEPGSYYARFLVGNETVTEKFIVQR